MENNKLDVRRVRVLDIHGKFISTTWANRAIKLIGREKAVIVSETPLTIQLLNEVKSNEK